VRLELPELNDMSPSDLHDARGADAAGRTATPKKKKKHKTRRKLLKRVFTGLAPWLVTPALYLLSRTWRVRILGDEEGCAYLDEKRRPPCVFGLWHSDDLTLGSIYAYRDVGIIISLSSDGELIARTLDLLGFAVFRGSSSKAGARGLLGIIRHVREGRQACITVDGPRGPVHKVKPGVVEIARKSGKPVIPIRTFAARAWRLPNTWNRAYLPKPFSVVTVICNAPLHPQKGAADEVRASLLEQVQKGLEETEQIARAAGVEGVDW
jgi:lysophospholipid acyltransferase (LPLAT)-like uncharacterized protein